MIDPLDIALAKKSSPPSRRRSPFRGDTTQTFVRLAEQQAPSFSVPDEPAPQAGRLRRRLWALARLGRRQFEVNSLRATSRGGS